MYYSILSVSFTGLSSSMFIHTFNLQITFLPFAISKDDTNQIYYMYINDMNYNHKPQNKVFAKNYYGDDRSLVVTTDVNPLPDEEYNKVIDYLKLIDEF